MRPQGRLQPRGQRASHAGELTVCGRLGAGRGIRSRRDARAFARRDVAAIGALTESNALRMHAAIMGSRPPIRYLSPQSVALFDAAERLRADGLEALRDRRRRPQRRAGVPGR